MIEESIRHALGASRRFIRWIALMGVVAYALSGIYSVKPNEQAVHQRFGRIVDPRVLPGIHYRLPWPIDRVDKVPIRTVHRLEIDDFQPGDDPRTAAGVFRMMTQLDSFCVTGDNNVVNVGCAIQYTISDPAAFMFRPVAPETILRAVACNSMLHCLSGMEVDKALTVSHPQIADAIYQQTNQRLEELGIGLRVMAVDLLPVRPPGAVKSYFDDVVNAQIDNRKMVNQAEADRNERVARADVEATRIIEEAKGAKATAIARAEGDASRFTQQLEEYRKSPAVTRCRLWLDFAKEVLAKIQRKYVVEADQTGPAAHIRIVTP